MYNILQTILIILVIIIIALLFYLVFMKLLIRRSESFQKSADEAHNLLDEYNEEITFRNSEIMVLKSKNDDLKRKLEEQKISYAANLENEINYLKDANLSEARLVAENHSGAIEYLTIALKDLERKLIALDPTYEARFLTKKQ